jgi:acyl-CoA synthetase (AMP-forming)/AMP-acid ligase II
MIDWERFGLVTPDARPLIPGVGPQTTAAIIDAPLRDTPRATALVGRRGRFDFQTLDREVDKAAYALRALGVDIGDRVAVCLPNDVDIVIAFLASQRLGAIWVGINAALAPREQAYMLEDAGARVLLAPPPVLAALEALEPLPELERRLALDPLEPQRGWLAELGRVPDDVGRPDVEIDPFAPAAIAYTSGTTGFPKGAVHSQHNLVLVAASLNRTGGLPEGVNVGVLLPLTILNLIARGVLGAYYGGRTLVCMDRHDAVGIATWVREERVGTMDTVPTHVRDLLTHPEVRKEDLASLVDLIVGGADCPPEVVELYRERFGRGVTIGYGMTEAPTGVARSAGEAPPAPGYCGPPVAQVEIQIVDEQDQLLPAGELGEICVVPASTGPFAGLYTSMLGYWNKPDATAEALRGGRYHTGDLGMLDEAGNIYVRGRRNELILRGGANVYPAEVERVLASLEGVSGAAVLGIADERLGERVVAAVELRCGSSLDEEALRSHVAEHLARYKVPDRILVVPALPRNSMQKVVKRELRDLFENRPSSPR